MRQTDTLGGVRGEEAEYDWRAYDEDLTRRLADRNSPEAVAVTERAYEGWLAIAGRPLDHPGRLQPLDDPVLRDIPPEIAVSKLSELLDAGTLKVIQADLVPGAPPADFGPSDGLA